MANAISDEALDVIFRTARTHNRWTDRPISDTLLMAVYDLMRWGPTAGNTTPARILFLTSQQAKSRLMPLLDETNREKTMAAPAIAIIGYDLDFPETLITLVPHDPKRRNSFASKPEKTHKIALHNSTLQGAYFIIAARALGLDCGPMGGFNNDGVDREFFVGTAIKSNFLCALGYGDSAGVKMRAPRLTFDQACRII